MVRHFCKLSKAVIHFRQSHLIVLHCYWQCLVFFTVHNWDSQYSRISADMPTFLFDMVTDYCKPPKAVFQFKQSPLIVPHCFWKCEHLQSTTAIANIAGFRDMADNAHILVRHDNTFLQTSKGCFPVQTITLHRSTLFLTVPTSTVDNWDSQYWGILRYGRQRPVRHGQTFLQTSKGCFPVETITRDRSTCIGSD